MGNTNYLISAVYRAENTDLLEGEPSPMETMLNMASKRSAHIILTGDLNVDLLKKTSNSNKLNELCGNIGLKNLIEGPTRIDSNSKTLIDHLWATEYCSIGKHGTIPGLSDHYGTCAEITKKIKKQKYKSHVGLTRTTVSQEQVKSTRNLSRQPASRKTSKPSNWTTL